MWLDMISCRVVIPTNLGLGTPWAALTQEPVSWEPHKPRHFPSPHLNSPQPHTCLSLKSSNHDWLHPAMSSRLNYIHLCTTYHCTYMSWSRSTWPGHLETATRGLDARLLPPPAELWTSKVGESCRRVMPALVVACCSSPYTELSSHGLCGVHCIMFVR